MARAHYHIGSNVPGYLPEGDVYTVETKSAAILALTRTVREYRESELDVPCGRRRTGRGSARLGYVYFSRPGDAYDLGIAFWWERCERDDCERDED